MVENERDKKTESGRDHADQEEHGSLNNDESIGKKHYPILICGNL